MGEMDGVLEAVKHAQAGRVEVVVSRHMENEVLDAAMDRETADMFHSLLKRPNVTWVDYEPPILNLAKEIREYYAGQKRALAAPVKVPGTSDAFHLATAINRKVDGFYTFDKGKKGGANLLALNGSVAGHALEICRPPFGQLALFARRR